MREVWVGCCRISCIIAPPFLSITPSRTRFRFPFEIALSLIHGPYGQSIFVAGQCTSVMSTQRQAGTSSTLQAQKEISFFSTGTRKHLEHFAI